MVKVLKNYLFIVVLLFSCFNNNVSRDDLMEVTFKSAVDSFNDGKYVKAKEQFLDLMYSNPLGNIDDCQFYIAECEYNLKNYKQAIVEYSKYLRSNYRKSSFTVKSEIMLCRCHYKLSMDFYKDQSDTYTALEKLQYYIEKESLFEFKSELSQMIIDLRNKLAKKDFETAKLYVRLEKYDSAKLYYNGILDEFYDSDYFDFSIINLSILNSFDSVENAKKFIQESESDFLDKQNYLEAIELMDSIEENKKIEYYAKLLR
tara:strand:+ start:19 stop:795 length:777 start_codon:yes stop_codon:yes gene_type:complete